MLTLIYKTVSKRLLPYATKYVAKIIFNNMSLRYKISQYESEIANLKQSIQKIEKAKKCSSCKAKLKN